MKTWNSHRRRLERGMVAGVLSAVVLTASMSIQVLAADSNTVFTSGEPQGAAIAVTANAGAAQNVSKSFLTYTDTAKQEKAEAEKQAEEARKAEKGRGGKKGRGRASEKAGPGGGYFSSGGIDLL